MTTAEKNLTTVHILVPVKWGNLNRDDQGFPKKTLSGGITRGLLSPQSLKRAARKHFESQSIEGAAGSCRSTMHALALTRSIITARPDLDVMKVALNAVRLITLLTSNKVENAPMKKAAEAILNELTGAVAEKQQRDADDNGATAVWLSDEEIAAAEALIIESVEANTNAPKLTNGGKGGTETITGKVNSLSIAALGRMNANATESNVQSSISVGPAVTVHEATIESDFFTAVDDRSTSQGAAHMGTKFHISGVFYRSFTIDRHQLRENWKAIDAPHAKQAAAQLIESLILQLPSGMSTNSDPYAMPLVVLSEQQGHRTAYDFETPVEAASTGGFSGPAIQRLDELSRSARNFMPAQFGQTMITGAAPLDKDQFPDAERPAGGLAEMVSTIADWMISQPAGDVR